MRTLSSRPGNGDDVSIRVRRHRRRYAPFIERRRRRSGHPAHSHHARRLQGHQGGNIYRHDPANPARLLKTTTSIRVTAEKVRESISVNSAHTI